MTGVNCPKVFVKGRFDFEAQISQKETKLTKGFLLVGSFGAFAFRVTSGILRSASTSECLPRKVGRERVYLPNRLIPLPKCRVIRHNSRRASF
jgi:hypothetical protein